MFTSQPRTKKSPRIPSGTCFSSLDICFLASDWALKYWLMWVKSHLLRLVIVLFSSEVISLQKESRALSKFSCTVELTLPQAVSTATPDRFSQYTPSSCMCFPQLGSQRKGQAAEPVECQPFAALISVSTTQCCASYYTLNSDWDKKAVTHLGKLQLI